MARKSIGLGRKSASNLCLQAAFSLALLGAATVKAGDQTLFSPFWTTERGHDTVLMVGNPVATSQSLTLRLFSDSGQAVLKRELRLEGAEGRSFSLRELLDGSAGSGHLQLSYGPDIRRLPAASLIRRGREQWTVELAGYRRIPEAKLLRTLVPSLEPGQRTVIAICNAGSRTAAGTIRITGQRQTETAWQLGPGQSRRLEFPHGPGLDGSGLAVEVERFSPDEPGLLAAGFSHSPSSGSFALHISAQGKDDGGQLAGFFTGERPLLALWNLSDQFETVALEARLPDGTMRSGQVALAAGAVEQFDLAQELGLQPGDEGALLASASPGRTVLGRILDAGPDRTVHSNPLRNPAQEDPAHGVPVRLGERFNTRFLLYNPNPEALRFSLLLYFGPERYTYPLDLLQPFEAAEIDLARARGELLAGQTGGFIPEGEVTGQAKIFQRNNLKGRLQLLSLLEEEGGERLSFHCTLCQPEPEEMLFEPGSASGLAGQTIDLPPAILYYDDGSSADVTPETTVSIADTSVASLASGHRANLLSAGSTPGVGSYTASLIEVDPECLLLVTVIATVVIVVQDPEPTISSILPDRISVGAQTTVTIRGSNFPVIPSLSISGGGITQSIQSASSTQIVARLTPAANATGGNRSVTVSGSNSRNLFIQIPTSLGVNSVQVGSQFSDATGNGCPPTPRPNSDGPYGMRARIIYQIRDQQGQPIRAALPVLEDLGAIVVDGVPVSGGVDGEPITPSGNSAADGTIDENAVGLCANFPFSVGTFLQDIFMPLSPSVTIMLRTNPMTQTGQLECGNITNTTDITLSVPCP